MSDGSHPRSFQSDQVARCLAPLSIGRRQCRKLLTLWPLISPAGAAGLPLACTTMVDAAAAGQLTVREVDHEGRVGALLARNTSDVPVLVLPGEELRGGKQHRVTRGPALIAPRSDVVLDALGVEHGRWAWLGSALRPTGVVMSAAIRLEAMRRSGTARRATWVPGVAGRLDAAPVDPLQRVVWAAVERRLRRSSTRSRTRAWAHHLETRAGALAELTNAFRADPGQVGFVVAIGERIVGLEWVARPDVFARAMAGLVGAYAVDAVDAVDGVDGADRVEIGAGGGAGATSARRANGPDPRVEQPSFDGPEAFVRAVADSPVTVASAVGSAECMRVRAPGLIGCCMRAGSMLQLTAFADAGEGG